MIGLHILIERLLVPHLAPLLEARQVSHELLTFSGYRDEEVQPLLGKADVFVSGKFRASWGGGASHGLRLIHCYGAGTDGIDLAAVPPGCLVCNVYGHERAIAEHVLMVMLALQRGLLAQDAALRRGDWGERRMLKELRGRTLLVVGLGHIGAEAARWARFAGMRVTGITRSPSPQRARTLGMEALGGSSDLPSFLGKADFVLVAVPLTRETTGLIGDRELRCLKPSAFLINVARGPVVDEEALYLSLRDRTIAGAAIDVWYQAPAPGRPLQPSRLPFHELDNIIMTPSLCGYTEETMRFRWEAIAENLHRLVRGQPLENVVWPQTDGRRHNP